MILFYQGPTVQQSIGGFPFIPTSEPSYFARLNCDPFFVAPRCNLPNPMYFRNWDKHFIELDDYTISLFRELVNIHLYCLYDEYRGRMVFIYDEFERLARDVAFKKTWEIAFFNADKQLLGIANLRADIKCWDFTPERGLSNLYSNCWNFLEKDLYIGKPIGWIPTYRNQSVDPDIRYYVVNKMPYYIMNTDNLIDATRYVRGMYAALREQYLGRNDIDYKQFNISEMEKFYDKNKLDLNKPFL